MSISQLQERKTNHFIGADADLLQRLRIALSVKKRAGWHLVIVSVQNGVVQLDGVVPTSYDRQLIAALVSHVAGVLGIEDSLEVGDPSIRQQVMDNDETPSETGSSTNVAPSQNPFLHLPTLPQSLDDILVAQAVNVAPAA